MFFSPCKYFLITYRLSAPTARTLLTGGTLNYKTINVCRGLRRLSRKRLAMPFFSRYDLECLFFPSSFSQMGYWVFYHHLYMHHSDMVWEQVNQIGSVTESIEAVKMSKRAGWGVMASHRRFEVDLEYCRHGVI